MIDAPLNTCRRRSAAGTDASLEGQGTSARAAMFAGGASHFTEGQNMKSTLISTTTGRVFDLADPQPRDIDLIDIATGLAHLGRWTGQTPVFYSVAQHSVICSELAEEEHRLGALLHDAAEAYLGDDSRPKKRILGRAILHYEERIEQAVAIRFGIAWPLPAPIRRIDDRMLVTEHHELRRGPLLWDPETFPPPRYEMRLTPWAPALARQEFLDRFHFLTGCAPEAFETWEPGR